MLGLTEEDGHARGEQHNMAKTSIVHLAVCWCDDDDDDDVGNANREKVKIPRHHPSSLEIAGRRAQGPLPGSIVLFQVFTTTNN